MHSTEGLTGAGVSIFIQRCPLTWLWAGSPFPFFLGLNAGLLEYAHDQGLTAEGLQGERAKRITHAFYDLVLDVTCYHYCFIQFIRSEALSLAHT